VAPSPPPAVTPAAHTPQTEPAPLIRIGAHSAPAPTAAAQTTPSAPLKPPAFQPKPLPARTVSQAAVELRKAVLKACGNKVREVRVEKGTDRQTILHVQANRETEQQVISTLLSMPEITSTNVRIEIRVSH
jgi:hypothetical protein